MPKYNKLKINTESVLELCFIICKVLTANVTSIGKSIIDQSNPTPCLCEGETLRPHNDVNI